MVGLIKPIQSEVIWQDSPDASYGLLKAEVNAARVTGQATHDNLMAMERNLTKSTKVSEHFALKQNKEDVPSRQHRRTLTAAGSSTDGPTAPHTCIGTARGRSPSRATQPESVRTKLVRFPYAHSEVHLKTVFAKLQQHDEDDMWNSTAPNFPSGGTQSGIRGQVQGGRLPLQTAAGEGRDPLAGRTPP